MKMKELGDIFWNIAVLNYSKISKSQTGGNNKWKWVANFLVWSCLPIMFWATCISPATSQWKYLIYFAFHLQNVQRLHLWNHPNLFLQKIPFGYTQKPRYLRIFSAPIFQRCRQGTTLRVSACLFRSNLRIPPHYKLWLLWVLVNIIWKYTTEASLSQASIFSHDPCSISIYASIYSSSVYTVDILISSTEFSQFMRRLDA